MAQLMRDEVRRRIGEKQRGEALASNASHGPVAVPSGIQMKWPSDGKMMMSPEIRRRVAGKPSAYPRLPSVFWLKSSISCAGT
jgi:hypothetical protein